MFTLLEMVVACLILNGLDYQYEFVIIHITPFTQVKNKQVSKMRSSRICELNAFWHLVLMR